MPEAKAEEPKAATPTKLVVASPATVADNMVVDVEGQDLDLAVGQDIPDAPDSPPPANVSVPQVEEKVVPAVLRPSADPVDEVERLAAKVKEAEGRYLQLGYEIAEMNEELTKKRKVCMEMVDKLCGKPEVQRLLQALTNTK